jgi:hypothetical protein
LRSAACPPTPPFCLALPRNDAVALSVRQPDSERFQVRRFNQFQTHPVRRLMALWSLSGMKGFWRGESGDQSPHSKNGRGLPPDRRRPLFASARLATTQLRSRLNNPTLSASRCADSTQFQTHPVRRLMALWSLSGMKGFWRGESGDQSPHSKGKTRTQARRMIEGVSRRRQHVRGGFCVWSANTEIISLHTLLTLFVWMVSLVCRSILRLYEWRQVDSAFHSNGLFYAGRV